MISRKFIPTALFTALSLLFSETVLADDNTFISRCSVSQKTDGGKFSALPDIKKSGFPVPENQAVRLTADNVAGETQGVSTAQGDVIAERDDQVLNSEKIVFDRIKNTAQSKTPFVLSNTESKISGVQLNYNMATATGIAEDAHFESIQNKARLQGEGKQVEMFSKRYYRLKDAVMNTCDPNDDSWYFKAKQIDADLDKNIGVAKNVSLVFKGVPILYSPWMDFPLNGSRKSGFLAPTLGGGSNGFELILPYYLNLAPNYDATLAAHLYSRRGLGFAGEFRYLQPKYSGIFSGDWLPNDKLKNNDNRYIVHFAHNQFINNKLSFGIAFNKASDNDYFRDLGNRIDNAEQSQLLQKAWLNYQDNLLGGSISGQLYVQKYQTLQDELRTLDEPYRIMPRLEFNWNRSLPYAKANVLAQFTRFDHYNKQTGNREILYPSIKWDFNNAWGFIRPKIGLHMSAYQVDAYQDADKKQNAYNETRILPIASLDSGLIFERDTSYFNKAYTQTLEPRLFYAYIPTKDQNRLPNFDSSENDFTFAQLFRENRFSGHDRINPTHSISTTINSRFFESDTGIERLRLGVGQRFYFKDEDINLSGNIEIEKKNKSDIVAFASGRITDSLYIDNNWHYNQNINKTQSYSTSVRFNPQAGKTISVRFGYDRNSTYYYNQNRELKHLDIGFQWPIKNQYYIIARQNYSLTDKKPLEQLFGIEYQSDCRCWSSNFVFQRYVTDYNKTKNAFFFQLNFRGLGGLGMNPTSELRRSVPGYSPISEVR